MTLKNHVNYLSQNMHTMVTQKQISRTLVQVMIIPHCFRTKYQIPRPPEWNTAYYNAEDTDDSFEFDADDSGEEQEEAEAGASDRKPQNTIPASAPEKVPLFPFLTWSFTGSNYFSL